MSGIDERNSVIALLRAYHTLPALWDVQHEDYSNHLIKKQQYEILLSKYKETNPDAYMKELKKKINTVRTNYRREVRRLRDAKAEGRIETSTLYYFNELTFLNSIEAGRPNKKKLQDFKESRHKIKKLYSNAFNRTKNCQKNKIIPPPVQIEAEQTEIKDDSICLSTSLNICNQTLPKIEIDAEQTLTKDDSVRLPTENMKRTSDNAYQHLSIHWSQKLSQMGNAQRIFAEKLINDVLFNGELGLLNFNTSITNLSPHQRKGTF